ncbi:unnamed protein product [Darwinula stevensoni]|uniref:Peptidase S8 pro-domain domain-containing protein n=1 Tax=Darwinula stevensoni TaxID=69355 RepID=A0A7R9ABQ8_9CRUS|nr:unnamed protein product [Darwinula stevensoni]CAG0899430.1 unnamed protein product [Darwinula stevensoni]
MGGGEDETKRLEEARVCAAAECDDEEVEDALTVTLDLKCEEILMPPPPRTSKRFPLGPLLFSTLLLLLHLSPVYSSPSTIYHNEFAVHIPAGSDVADRIAEKHGFVNHGQGVTVVHYRWIPNGDSPTVEERLDVPVCGHWVSTPQNPVSSLGFPSCSDAWLSPVGRRIDVLCGRSVHPIRASYEHLGIVVVLMRLAIIIVWFVVGGAIMNGLERESEYNGMRLVHLSLLSRLSRTIPDL